MLLSQIDPLQEPPIFAQFVARYFRSPTSCQLLPKAGLQKPPLQFSRNVFAGESVAGDPHFKLPLTIASQQHRMAGLVQMDVSALLELPPRIDVMIRVMV